MKLPPITSEVRRWAIAALGLAVGAAGLAMLWGIGWGLLLFGIGCALITLLYDPDRRPSP